MAERILIRNNKAIPQGGEGKLFAADVFGPDNTIYVSPEYSNVVSSQTYKAIDVTCVYRNLVAGGQVGLQTLIEGKDLEDEWQIIGYQFDPFRLGQTGLQRSIIVDPTMFWPDAGVSNIVWAGGKTLAEISPQQVTLPQIWRVRTIMELPLGIEDFTSVGLKVVAELFNPQ